MKNNSSILATLYANRALIWRLSLAEVRERYASTVFGSLWAVLQPAILIMVFWFVFAYGLRLTSPAAEVPFFLLLIVGLGVWFCFSDAVQGGTNAVTQRAYLVKKIAFPLEILPVVPVVSALLVHAVMLMLILVILAVNDIYPTWKALSVLYYAAALVVFSSALAYLLSALNVFHRDVGQTAGVMLQLWFWLTPIIWSPDMFSGTARRVLEMNPMYYIVVGYREALLHGYASTLTWQAAATFWIITGLTLGTGVMLFRRLQPDFADVL